MIKSLKDYAAEKGYSRQYVYAIRNKLLTVELPIFVEYEGVRYEIGKQIFVIEK